MGGLWQALAFGFAGLRLTPEGIALDPHLPSEWRSLTLRVQVRGNPLRVTVRRNGVDVSSAKPVRVELPASVALAPSVDAG
jgi:alpha,alpha-trehalose phosphorylase